MLCTLAKEDNSVRGMCVCVCKERNVLEERLIGTLGRDHTVGDGRVCDFGTVIFVVWIWLAFDVCDPGHGVGSLLKHVSKAKWSIF